MSNLKPINTPASKSPPNVIKFLQDALQYARENEVVAVNIFQIDNDGLCDGVAYYDPNKITAKAYIEVVSDATKAMGRRIRGY